MVIRLMVIILFIIPVLGRGKVTKYQVYGRKTHEYSLKEVCESFNKSASLLVNVVNQSNLDCMGTKISIKEFCLKKWKESKELLRGYVDKKNNRVKCLLGKRVVLKYKCQKEDQFCENAKMGCQKFRKRFSYQLDIFHDSMTSDHSLNCIYEKESEITRSDMINRSIL